MTNNVQLYDISKKFLGDKFLGVYMFDDLPKMNKKKPYAIINDGKLHWLGVIYDNDKYIIFDTFGRNIEDIMPIKTKNIKKTDNDKNQQNNQLDCGLRVISWLILDDKYGGKYSKLI